MEAGPPREGISSRDVRTTRFWLRAFSRSRRRISAASPRQLKTTIRSATEAKIDVTSGTSTMIVNEAVLKTPRLRPTEAMTISRVPRAFSPAPSAIPAR